MKNIKKKVLIIVMVFIFIFESVNMLKVQVKSVRRTPAKSSITTETLVKESANLEVTEDSVDEYVNKIMSVTLNNINLEDINEAGTWENLLKISEKKIKSSKEDKYLIDFIDSLDSFCEKSKVEFSVNKSDVTDDLFLEKCEAVIEIYNRENYPKLKLNENEQDSATVVQLDVTKKIDSVEKIQIGEKIKLKNETQYWEKSDNFGSGKSGILNNMNEFLPEDEIFIINGVSFLDLQGIQNAEYVTYSEIDIENQISEEHIFEVDSERKEYMIHICTKDTDIGWVNSKDIVQVFLNK